MGSRKTRALPARLKGIQQRFERWRRTRKISSRIPGPLWAAAAKMAGTYGFSRTAQALRVNYHALKRRCPSGKREKSFRGEPCQQPVGAVMATALPRIGDAAL